MRLNCCKGTPCDLGRLTLQVLDDAPETVAVGGDEHPLALFDLRDDLVVPEGQSAGDRVLQALARRELVLRQVGIATVLWESHGQYCKDRASGVGITDTSCVYKCLNTLILNM